MTTLVEALQKAAFITIGEDTFRVEAFDVLCAKDDTNPCLYVEDEERGEQYNYTLSELVDQIDEIVIKTLTDVEFSK